MVLTNIKLLLLLYRERNNDQELEQTTKNLELTTIELDEEQTGTTDKSETIENQPSQNTTLTSAEQKNDDFGCFTMDSNSPSIVNGRKENFRVMEQMIAF